MKQFKQIGILGMLVLLAFSFSGYASGDPLKKAPPKHSVSFNIHHDGNEPILKEGYVLSNAFAVLPPLYLWEDRQCAYGDNWKAIRFRNYFADRDHSMASALCENPYKSPRHGIMCNTGKA